MELSLALCLSLFGVILLALCAVFRLSESRTSLCIQVAFFLLLAGLVKAAISPIALPGVVAISISLLSFSGCTLSYFLYVLAVERFLQAGGVEGKRRALGEDGRRAGDEGTKPPSKPGKGTDRGRDDKPKNCQPRFIEGEPYKKVSLSAKRGRTKYFESTHEVTIAWKEWLIFNADAWGYHWAGFRYHTYQARIGHFSRSDEEKNTYLLVECIDGCKIVPTKSGSFRGQDGPLVVEFDVTHDLYDSMDLINIYVRASANIEGMLSVSLQGGIPNTPNPGIGFNDVSAVRSREMGTWSAKCKPMDEWQDEPQVNRAG